MGSPKVSPWACIVELYDKTRHETKEAAIGFALAKVKLQAPNKLRWKVYFDNTGTGPAPDAGFILGHGEEMIDKLNNKRL